jgi:hypothetical protein
MADRSALPAVDYELLKRGHAPLEEGNDDRAGWEG